MTCKPCRVTFDEDRWQINRDGTVQVIRPSWQDDLHGKVIIAACDPIAKAVRAEASRQRRNRNARERHDALRSLGLVKTPYGWE